MGLGLGTKGLIARAFRRAVGGAVVRAVRGRWLAGVGNNEQWRGCGSLRGAPVAFPVRRVCAGFGFHGFGRIFFLVESKPETGVVWLASRGSTGGSGLRVSAPPRGVAPSRCCEA